MFKVVCVKNFGFLPLFKANVIYEAEEKEGRKVIVVYPHENHQYGYEFTLEKFVEYFKRK